MVSLNGECTRYSSEVLVVVVEREIHKSNIGRIFSCDCEFAWSCRWCSSSAALPCLQSVVVDVKGKFISFGCDDNLFSYSPAAAVAVCGTLVGTPSRGDNFWIPILPLKYNCWQSHFSWIVDPTPIRAGTRWCIRRLVYTFIEPLAETKIAMSRYNPVCAVSHCC